MHAQGMKFPGVPFIPFDAADPAQHPTFRINCGAGDAARIQGLVNLLQAVAQSRPSLGVIAFERSYQDLSSLLPAGFAKCSQIANSYLQAAALVKPSSRIASQKSISASTGCNADR
jgi:hypothetical protein